MGTEEFGWFLVILIIVLPPFVGWLYYKMNT